MRRRAKVVSTAAAAVLALLAGCATPAPPPPSAVTIDPCTTDPAIACDATFGHIATRASGTSRGRLVLFFNGTGAQPLAYTKLLGALSANGYHTIGLRYVSSVGTTAACPEADAGSQPDCHRSFRAETVFGAGVPDPNGWSTDSPAISVSAANSVVNRAIKVVEHLRTTQPQGGWGAFQQRDANGCTPHPVHGGCDLDWSKVVLMGHSLGAGVALYASKLHAAAGVAMLSGPFDHYGSGSNLVVAPWIAEGGFATNSGSMRGLSHTGEPDHASQTTVWSTLGMYGPAVSVDSGSPPWGYAQQLTTSAAAACLLDGAKEHNSTAQNLCTPGDPPVLRGAWVHLAGG